MAFDNINAVVKEKLALVEFNKAFHFEFDHLRPMQLKCLRGIQDQDIVSVIPTGYGKSLIFELLPFFQRVVRGESCIVLIIVPLNSLIDQECAKLGDMACGVTSDNDTIPEKTFYIGHPEDILYNAAQIARMSKTTHSTFIIVDEAHCILEWGGDFRPDYSHIGELRPFFKNVRMMATTATASQEAQNAIAINLGMLHYAVYNTTPTLNQNIMISVTKRLPSSIDQGITATYNYVYKPLLLELMMLGKNFPLTIIYCKLKWCAYGIELARRLMPVETFSSGEISLVTQYHAQQPKELNQAIIASLASNETNIRLIFATIALGMGCDLRHVKRVIHAGPPTSMEAYVQEIGRAGRDGSGAQATLLYNATDLSCHNVSDSMKEFCVNEALICRRSFVFQYFKTIIEAPVASNCCDICSGSDSSDFKPATLCPSLIQRQTMRNALEAYAAADKSNLIEFDVIRVITDVFEFLNDTQQICDIFKIPREAADSILRLKEVILHM